MASTAFNRLQSHCRRVLWSLKLLKYYDSNKKLYLEVDASQKTIGMALLQSVQEDFESKANGCQQNWIETNVNDYEQTLIPNDLLPVAYGSKTPTDTESQYANIECELLGVVARVEKFHTFCYGRSTIVLSNHKPLAFIVQKTWSMHLQGYKDSYLDCKNTM